MDEFTKIAIESSELASVFIKQNYGKTLTIKNKNPKNIKDFVTDVDKKAEEIIINKILKHFPNHGIWGEESGKTTKNKEFVWVIDPIDGTKNFVRGLDQFAVSVGLVKNGNPFVGVLSDPVKGDFVWAKEGAGAFLGKNRIKLQKVSRFEDTSVAINFGKRADQRIKVINMMKEIYKDIPIIRMVGSTAFVVKRMVEGGYDALIDNGDYWDFAASIVVFKESGGVVSSWGGNEVDENTDFVLWANQGIYYKLLNLARRL